ncbi:MAG: ATP-dependent RecD-like DNA helicase, partial [Candidatus Binatia bacterium]|nr:ATP-dependent RecD-like DNA helicase [Candidatus Binatia bacterium]
WEKQKGMREIMVFLQGHGVSSGFALRIYRVFGPQTINRVKENPYGLAREIKGIGFILADRIAGSLGIEANSPLRIEAGVLYTLEKFTESGNCFAPLDLLTKNASSLLKIETAAVERIVEKLGAHGDVVLEEPRESQGTRVYPQALYQAERRIVQFLLQLLSQPSSLSLPQGAKVLEQAETQMDLLLEKEQQEAILQAVRHKVLVITGGPGTGKTTLLTHLLVLFRRFNISFALAAPTGRAAKRMSEMAGEEAKTVHRLLEYNPRDGGFQRNENNPLEADIVIIDEASMLDLPLTDHLLGAVRANSHLILIGDADQLPPVGPGNILRDLIESGAVPVVVLRHIFRQDRESLIVVNAHRILRGEPLLLETERKNPDFVFIERESQQEILETVKELIREKVPQWFQTGSSRMVQVLSPMNRGLLGTVHLNRELQSLLNPEGEFIERGERLFRVADKVMQLRNNYDKGVFNGDLGWIERVDREEEKVRVRFDGQVVAYDFDELDELSLAYATSVHKSQGSEYPAVVISLHTTHYPMLHRSVLYTAVTRGKKLVALVGNRRALWMAIKNLRVEQRFTGLREKLAGI